MHHVSATIGIPITLENFTAASKIDVASASSRRGNQSPVALEWAREPGASVTPRGREDARVENGEKSAREGGEAGYQRPEKRTDAVHAGDVKPVQDHPGRHL